MPDEISDVRRPKPNWTLPRPLAVPMSAGWLAEFFYRKCVENDLAVSLACQKSGVKRSTVDAWRYGAVPGVDRAEAILNAIGYTLIPVPLAYKRQLLERAERAAPRC